MFWLELTHKSLCAPGGTGRDADLKAFEESLYFGKVGIPTLLPLNTSVVMYAPPLRGRVLHVLVRYAVAEIVATLFARRLES